MAVISKLAEKLSLNKSKIFVQSNMNRGTEFSFFIVDKIT